MATARVTTPPSPIHLGDLSPLIDGGRVPIRRVVGDTVEVSIDVVAPHTLAVRGAIRYRLAGQRKWQEVSMSVDHDNPDRFRGFFSVTAPGKWNYIVDVWGDLAETWRSELRRRVNGEQADIDIALADGNARFGTSFASADEALVDATEFRSGLVHSDTQTVAVDATLARFSSWYEMFPRSFGGLNGVRQQLPRLAELGFDVIYLPPIHPIGQTHRKGRDNSLTAEKSDPGSPWAIGDRTGGHTAILKDLGTFKQFDQLIADARKNNIEIALDMAFQCSPDHPWITEHPEWFKWRPDGTIQFAENPPKKYEDIVGFDFDSPAWKSLWEALYDVIDFWIDHGVRVFRIDNPHTKPIEFWQWLITTVHEERPEIVFLAEAFTRPAMMKELAKIGFSQSYTYFTWRNQKHELIAYVNELNGEMGEYFRPNFFANTPDILSEYLQHGGPAAFTARLVLAATLSPSYGIYSGFENYENVAVHENSEEYVHSEKYEAKTRTLDGPLLPMVQKLNQLRRSSTAFQRLDNVQFIDTANDQLIAYVKRDHHGGDGNVYIVCVNVNTAFSCEGLVEIPHNLGLPSRFTVDDVLTDKTFTWQLGGNYVLLGPGEAHVLAVK